MLSETQSVFSMASTKSVPNLLSLKLLKEFLFPEASIIYLILSPTLMTLELKEMHISCVLESTSQYVNTYKGICNTKEAKPGGHFEKCWIPP